jgi:hypothetical protein
MKKICIVLTAVLCLLASNLQAQKGKNKGGGNEKVNIKIKTNNDQVKIKTNGKNDQVKIDIKNKGDHGHEEHGDGHYDNGNHYGQYKNKTVWFFGPGDIYQVHGKSHHERIIIFNQVCVRLTTNIGFLFGLIGDVRIKLDGKKATMKPERYKKIKLEIDLLDADLRLIEIKKNKIKLRLAKLKTENEHGDDND